jgi:solute:Na+ symporter, SSS family
MDPFIYQYGVGGLVFGIGIYFAIKQGYISTQGSGLRNAIITFGGLLFFFLLQGYLQYAPMEERAPYKVVDENGSPRTPLATDFPAERVKGSQSTEEIEIIQNSAQQILNKTALNELKKKKQSGEISEDEFKKKSVGLDSSKKLGTNLDYAVMIGYFMAMLGIGTWFGRGQSTTKDFFFGGQRFSWWLIAFSLVATTIGSASFVKYSKIAYSYGIASSQTYLNDWFWIPLLLFGWLPILYFSKVVSIPEYFERRFNPMARKVSTYLLLAYLIGYVGINLFTMGQALHILIGWPIFISALLVASISTTYVTFGGQTSVIMTDLFQGVMLLLTGVLLLLFGISYLGGFDDFWAYLPRTHRMAFPDFNADPSYPAVGIFWQDAMANSAMFYFLNQGMVMRLMAARSVNDSRKAMITMLLILMPIAALVVASGGWVGQSLVSAGVLPEMEPKEAFFVTANFLSSPGIFGLIMAALTAALMSTVDTLITAISAIVVNDIYKPIVKNASEAQMLKMARISAVSIAIIGVLLVPVFNSFGSIYAAHGAFTAAITPPLVITLLLGVFWHRFSGTAALITMLLGTAIIFASVIYPEMITPFAHGVPMKEAKEGFFAGKDQYKFMRGFFGISVCLCIGIISGLMSAPSNKDKIKGLVWGTISDAIKHYKGSDGDETESNWAIGLPIEGTDTTTEQDLPMVYISHTLAQKLEAKEKDLLYISDSRAWLGGLKSGHAIIGGIKETLQDEQLELSPMMYRSLVRLNHPLRIKRMY